MLHNLTRVTVDGLTMGLLKSRTCLVGDATFPTSSCIRVELESKCLRQQLKRPYKKNYGTLANHRQRLRWPFHHHNSLLL
jgi:hypothetical protein